jgi:hypothetical protein
MYELLGYGRNLYLLSRRRKTTPFFSYTTKHILLLYAHRSIVIKAEVSVCALCYDDDPTNVYMNVYECNE